MLREAVLILCGCTAAVAAVTDWRSRRIPNWLTMSGAVLGIAANSAADGWSGSKSSLLGLGLGLALLLPFVLVRALGAGDWKLAGAMGSFLGPRPLLGVLMVAVLVAGVMAMVLIIYKRRVGDSIRNIGKLLLAFAGGHAGDPTISVDNPQSLKIPFGVALAIAVILFVSIRLLMPSVTWQ
jgi:prepilin peptidase CpaA